MASIEKSLLLAIGRKKKITIQLVLEYIGCLKSNSRSHIQQTYALLPSIAHLLFLFSLNLGADVTKLKNTFYFTESYRDPNKVISNRPKKGYKHTKKDKIDEVNGELSLGQILNQTISADKNIVELTPVPQTLKKEGEYEKEVNNITIEPFDADVIEQISQEMMSNCNSKVKQNDLIMDPFKFQQYKKLLELTQKGNLQSITTKKKKIKTSKKQGKVKDRLDLMIQIDEEPVDRVEEIELLITKVKFNREKQFSVINYVSKMFSKMNPLLLQDFDLHSLKQKSLNEHQNRQVQQARHYIPPDSFFYQNSEDNFLTPFKNKNGQKDTFFVIENNDPSITQQLQQKIKYLISQKLQIAQEINFDEFCQSKNISNEVRGELFYQFLSLNFSLKQQSPEYFSDIKISLAANH